MTVDAFTGSIFETDTGINRIQKFTGFLESPLEHGARMCAEYRSGTYR